jgi:FtsK/SpoIIIE family
MIPVEIRITRRHDGASDDFSIVVTDSTTTVRDLATVLGLSADIRIDQRTVRGDTQLMASGIGQGSIVESFDRDVRPSRPGVVTLHQIAGLNAGGSISLDAGRYAIGSVGPARSELRLGSAGSPRFILLVHDHGGCELTPGSGEPILIDGIRLGQSTVVTTQVIDADGALFRITPGSAGLARRRSDHRGEVAIDHHGREHSPSIDELQVTLPSAALAHGKRSRMSAEERQQLAEELEAAKRAAMMVLRAAQPDVAELRARVAEQAATVWERQRNEPDLLRLTMLMGDRTWSPVASGSPANETATGLVHAAERLAAVPIDVSLDDVIDLDIVGARHATLAVARRLLIETASLHGPDVVRISVASDHVRAWDFLKWLPHLNADAATHEIVVLDGGALPPLVSGRRRHVLALRADEHRAGARLVVEANGRAIFDDGTGRGSSVGTAVGISETVAAEMARDLAPLRFVERDSGPPRASAISDILELDDPVRRSDAVLARWNLSANAPVAFIPIGRTRDGLVEVGFSEGSHLLIAGAASSGRSTALQTLAFAIASTCSPASTRMILIDAGAEATFSELATLPQVAVATDGLDTDAALKALRSATESYVGTTFVLIDDATTLLAADPEAAKLLVELAYRPQTHLVVASRRGSSVLTGELRNTFDTRLVLDADVDQEPVLLERIAPSVRAAVGLRPGLAWLIRRHDDPLLVQLAAIDAQPGLSRHAVEARPFGLVSSASRLSRPDALAPFIAAVNEAARRGGWSSERATTS